MCAYKICNDRHIAQREEERCWWGFAIAVYRVGEVEVVVVVVGCVDDFLHAQSTVKCPFNHPQKSPRFICAAAQIYISKHPPY